MAGETSGRNSDGGVRSWGYDWIIVFVFVCVSWYFMRVEVVKRRVRRR